MGEFERRLLVESLARTGGVRTQAAKLLGISFRSLRYRLQKHALSDEEVGESFDDTLSPDSSGPIN
jgi:two-component system response regulator PilR (NtrC family)